MLTVKLIVSVVMYWCCLLMKLISKRDPLKSAIEELPSPPVYCVSAAQNQDTRTSGFSHT